MTSPSTARRVSALAAALLATITIAGCTGGGTSRGTSAPTGGGTSRATSSPATASVPPKLLDYSLDQVAATAKSTTFLSNQAEATVSVASAKATDDTTVLTFWITTPQSWASPISSSRPETWPLLIDAGTDQRYGVNTFTGVQGFPYCVCTDVNLIEPTRRVLTAQYPPLPAGLTQVTLRLTGFPDLLVQLTR